MTFIQRLLALDAALCAFEGVPCLRETEGIVQLLRLAVTKEIDSHDDIPPIFDLYLKAQKEAVEALANNPSVFGAE